jgi:hypothetical protein
MVRKVIHAFICICLVAFEFDDWSVLKTTSSPFIPCTKNTALEIRGAMAPFSLVWR